MGGGPSISGGMSYAEQKALMQEEREFQQKMEKERIKAAQDAETQRVAREQAERDRQKAQEMASRQETTQAEQEAILEAQAQTDVEEQKSMRGDSTKALDFYYSLYKGTKTP